MSLRPFLLKETHKQDTRWRKIASCKLHPIDFTVTRVVSRDLPDATAVIGDDRPRCTRCLSCRCIRQPGSRTVDSLAISRTADPRRGGDIRRLFFSARISTRWKSRLDLDIRPLAGPSRGGTITMKLAERSRGSTGALRYHFRSIEWSGAIEARLKRARARWMEN